MKSSTPILALALASLLLASGLPARAAEKAEPRTQTTEEFIEALKPRPPEAATRTRGMGAGSASQAAAVARPTPTLSPLELVFGFNSTRIEGESHNNAERLAKALQSKDLKGGVFVVVGHTDAVGSRQSNQALSQRRADAVRRFLIERGVSADRLRAEGRGFDDLKNKADPEADENRRVEIVAKY